MQVFLGNREYEGVEVFVLSSSNFGVYIYIIYLFFGLTMGFWAVQLAVLTRIGDSVAAVEVKIRRNDCLYLKFDAAIDGGGVDCLRWLGHSVRS